MRRNSLCNDQSALTSGVATLSINTLWIGPQTLNRKDPGQNLLAAAVVVPLGKALYPHC